MGGSIVAERHFVSKLEDVRLHLLNKRLDGRARPPRGPVLFVHGSSMASEPCFDLMVGDSDAYSLMNLFAREGFDAWCLDCEGYGRSDKWRDRDYDVADGIDDLEVAVGHILDHTKRERVHLYGGSSGALRAAGYASRRPDRVDRLVLDALVWTGEGSPTLTERRKRLPQFQAARRRPLDAAFIRTIFERDHPGTADPEVIAAFSEAVVALDTSIPNGTYIDMCTKLPLVDPASIHAPTLIMRGEWDGIAAFEDVAAFFARIPHPDKQFAVLPGIAHSSFHGKNHALAKHVLLSFLTRPEPVYTGRD
ncbi:alpha/beta hydrolase [Prosthecomicrobium sp. N25]|uniref:alpha/beta hydrolase n=1 Tax=Prosthecomicrobium sp. N25 TaxID=3129254 RepID=UPI003077306D